jgi:hypothetical protein
MAEVQPIFRSWFVPGVQYSLSRGRRASHRYAANLAVRGPLAGQAQALSPVWASPERRGLVGRFEQMHIDLSAARVVHTEVRRARVPEKNEAVGRQGHQTLVFVCGPDEDVEVIVGPGLPAEQRVDPPATDHSGVDRVRTEQIQYVEDVF